MATVADGTAAERRSISPAIEVHEAAIRIGASRRDV
jgi:hypothetical protein